MAADFADSGRIAWMDRSLVSRSADNIKEAAVNGAGRRRKSRAGCDKAAGGIASSGR
ncbi:hypothetical protein BN1221_02006 [Brenneria goodwinii]|uniref:Uncharacterized protein n=1 Tax=Brenneria goodwinii TaxID=1109412 RepID=A0A0G4JUI5_9GAMM|nr:hypothetical protein BN1221_02006 [Brenneria goodwinii]